MNFEKIKMTALINGVSLLKLPLLAFCTPQVVHMSETESEVRIRLDYRTKNHLGVMYFGALAMGAELSIALKAIREIQKSGQRIDFIFQDFEAKFLKRADGHTNFRCRDAAGVADLIRKAAASPERFAATFEGEAYVPEKGAEPVMTYKLTLSVKNRTRKA